MFCVRNLFLRRNSFRKTARWRKTLMSRPSCGPPERKPRNRDHEPQAVHFPDFCGADTETAETVLMDRRVTDKRSIHRSKPTLAREGPPRTWTRLLTGGRINDFPEQKPGFPNQNPGQPPRLPTQGFPTAETMVPPWAPRRPYRRNDRCFSGSAGPEIAETISCHEVRRFPCCRSSISALEPLGFHIAETISFPFGSFGFHAAETAFPPRAPKISVTAETVFPSWVSLNFRSAETKLPFWGSRNFLTAEAEIRSRDVTFSDNLEGKPRRTRPPKPLEFVT